MANLYDLVFALKGDIGDLKSKMDDAVGVLGKAEAAGKKLSDQWDSIAQGATKLGTAMTAAITAPLLGAAVASLKLAGDLEQAKVAFSTMLGSAAAAQVHLDKLREFAMKTPFEFPDLVNASKRLQALGFSASEIIPTLKAVGNAAAALGTGAEGIERITTALGQMRAKGKVSAEEMRQLAEAGIPAWQILAEAISKTEGRVVSVAEVMKRSEKGMIDGVSAAESLLKGMDQRFGGLMEAQSKTLLGVWSNFKDQMTKLGTDLGEVLAPFAKRALEAFMSIGEGISEIVARFKELPDWAKTAAIGFAALLAAVGPLALAVAASASAMGTLAPIIATIGTHALAAGSALRLVVETALGIAPAFGPATLAATNVGLAFGAIAKWVPIIGGAFAAWELGTLVANLGLVATGTKDVEKGIASLGEQVKQETTTWENFKKGFTAELGDGGKVASFAEGLGAAIRGVTDVLQFGVPILKYFNSALEGMQRSFEGAEQAARKYINATRDSMNFKPSTSPLGFDVAPEFAQKLIKDLDTQSKAHFEALEKAAAAAKEHAKNLKAAFSDLGLKDVDEQARKAAAAFKFLWENGKLVNPVMKELAELHLAEALKKVPNEIEKIRDGIAKLLRETRLEFDPEKTFQKNTDQAAEQIKKLQAYLDGLRDRFGDRLPNSIKGYAASIEGAIAINKQFISSLDAKALDQAIKDIVESARVHTKELRDTLQKDALAAGEQLTKTLVDASVSGIEKLPVSWDEAFKKLQIHRQANLDEVIRLNKEVQESDFFTAHQKVEAERNTLKMILEERAAMGEKVSEEDRRRLAVLNAQLKGVVVEQSAAYENFKQNIRGIYDDLQRGMTDVIFGAKSLGEVFTNVWKSIQVAFVDMIMKSVFDDLKKAFFDTDTSVQALGNSIKKVMKEIGDLFGGIGGIFGGGSKTPGAPPGTPSVPGGGSGGFGGGAGIADMIGSIGGMISSIIGNFQMKAMNKSLDIIVKHTLQTANDLANLRADEWERETHLMLKLDDIWSEIRFGFQSLLGVLRQGVAASMVTAVAVASQGGPQAQSAIQRFSLSSMTEGEQAYQDWYSGKPWRSGGESGVGLPQGIEKDMWDSLLRPGAIPGAGGTGLLGRLTLTQEQIDQLRAAQQQSTTQIVDAIHGTTATVAAAGFASGLRTVSQVRATELAESMNGVGTLATAGRVGEQQWLTVADTERLKAEWDALSQTNISPGTAGRSTGSIDYATPYQYVGNSGVNFNAGGNAPITIIINDATDPQRVAKAVEKVLNDRRIR